jgi:hypothetical protein
MTRKHKKWTNGDFLDTHKKQQKITLNETTQDLNMSDNITNITKNTENKITKKNEQDHKCYKKTSQIIQTIYVFVENNIIQNLDFINIKNIINV